MDDSHVVDFTHRLKLLSTFITQRKHSELTMSNKLVKLSMQDRNINIYIFMRICNMISIDISNVINHHGRKSFC